MVFWEYRFGFLDTWQRYTRKEIPVYITSKVDEVLKKNRFSDQLYVGGY